MRSTLRQQECVSSGNRLTSLADRRASWMDGFECDLDDISGNRVADPVAPHRAGPYPKCERPVLRMRRIGSSDQAGRSRLWAPGLDAA
jgi:hypothetical protein